LDAFVCACGTGGTLAGVASFLKRKDARISCFLVDPQGSSLYNKVTRGVLYTHQEAEGKRLRNPFDTITEGVGINRLTKNFAVALGTEALFPGESDGSQASLISGAFRCSDREAVEMSRFLARTDGLFLGSSSCVNVVGAVKAARSLGPGHRVVTIACDGGGRHLSKFWSDEYLEKHGLTPTARGLEFLEET
jgi:cysteine synthase A